MNVGTSLKELTKNLLLLTLPSLIIAVVCLEIFVRLTWDDKQGVPGMRIEHPTRHVVFTPNYTGYFLNLPLRINNLGFRDDKDYEIEKSDKVFRIMVLGDSVTFGTDARFNETWPYLFQKRLEEWDPDTIWQVWNMGTPGYNTYQELTVLEETGPSYKPDLVIIGYFENDAYAPLYNHRSKLLLKLKGFFQDHFYLAYKIKHIYHVLKGVGVTHYSHGMGRTFTITQAVWAQRASRKPDVSIPPFDASSFKFKHGLPSSPLPQKNRTSNKFG